VKPFSPRMLNKARENTRRISASRVDRVAGAQFQRQPGASFRARSFVVALFCHAMRSKFRATALRSGKDESDKLSGVSMVSGDRFNATLDEVRDEGDVARKPVGFGHCMRRGPLFACFQCFRRFDTVGPDRGTPYNESSSSGFVARGVSDFRLRWGSFYRCPVVHDGLTMGRLPATFHALFGRGG